ncbi:response regulator [Pleurocapsales cyanobacterium LEGE 10410]|nr:response regulator [Pleurocapsales cyanobacterium LEGE 10410]
MMPEMNGYEVIDYLRHHQNVPNIPILLMTANQEVSYEDAKSAGANNLVYKPLDLTQFLTKVKSFAV